MSKFRYAKPAPIKWYGYFPAAILRRKYSGGFRFHCRYGPCVRNISWQTLNLTWQVAEIVYVIYDCKYMAPLTDDDKILTKALRLEKGWSALTMMREFPSRNRKRSTLLSASIRPEKLTDEKVAARGRLWSARTASNAQIVGDLICSQADRPGTSKSPREIELVFHDRLFVVSSIFLQVLDPIMTSSIWRHSQEYLISDRSLSNETVTLRGHAHFNINK